MVTRPVHPAIVDRPTWEAAQNIAAEDGTGRDDDGLSRHPAAVRSYAYRSLGLHGELCPDRRRRAAETGAEAGLAGVVPHQLRHPAAGVGCLVVTWVRGLRARSGRGVPVSCPVLARTRDGERARVLPGPARGRSAPVLRRLFTLPPGRSGGPGHRG